MSGPQAEPAHQRTPEEQAFATLCSAIADVAATLGRIEAKIDLLGGQKALAVAPGGVGPQSGQRPAKAEPYSDQPIPQPERLIESPETLPIHFGKNKGRTLGQLSENSIAWYCAKWDMRPKDDGTFWDNDIKLLNAARQLWHLRRGTLNTSKS